MSAHLHTLILNVKLLGKDIHEHLINPIVKYHTYEEGFMLLTTNRNPYKWLNVIGVVLGWVWRPL
ncbi:hypothetical protein SAMN04488601_102201 [Paenibacillus sp. 453mf]|nr:hypothetical protein SAMN04488601_102201 [Paenibacillus sp. 453mf]